MSKQILKVHISWKNDRTFYIETDSDMTNQEIGNYVSLLQSTIERAIREYNDYGNVESNALYDFMMQGTETIFPLPPLAQCNASQAGQPYEVAVEWNANDSAFNDWELSE